MMNFSPLRIRWAAPKYRFSEDCKSVPAGPPEEDDPDFPGETGGIPEVASAGGHPAEGALVRREDSA